MKNINRLLIIISFILFSNIISAQKPPHPNGGKVPGSSGTTNEPVGGGAPIGSGDLILFALAVAYAGRKIQLLRSEAKVD